MTYFLDANFPPQFAASLRPFGHDLVHITDVPDLKSGQDTKDEEWIRYVAGKRWVALTCDRRILTARRESEIFFAAKLTTFFMPKGYTNHKLWTQFQLLVKAWERIDALAQRAQLGDCFDVTEGGKVDLMPSNR